MNWKGCGRRWWPNLRNAYVWRDREKSWQMQVSDSLPGRDSNRIPPEYKTGELPLQPICSTLHQRKVYCAQRFAVCVDPKNDSGLMAERQIRTHQREFYHRLSKH
jgi:hypothetical protein